MSHPKSESPAEKPEKRDMVEELREVRAQLFGMRLALTESCAELERARHEAQFSRRTTR